MQLNEHPSNYIAINVAINARIDQKLENYKKTPLNFLTSLRFLKCNGITFEGIINQLTML